MTARSGAIAFRDVWKKYRRGVPHGSLRDIAPMVRRWIAPRAPRDTLRAEEFWAVADLSLAVGAGEVLGVIGPNGAGKSTLLKLATGILRPERGAVSTTGRVGALIELAAGFHPDLSGRENVYLQGAMMGMPRKETARKFDQIVAFAGVEDFIDTQVKRYSSGMHARLGFAIAAHLDPDVLLVDEVLAVGDLGFQRRAMARLREIVSDGVPVVLVSHQLDRVAALCTRAILLVGGRVRFAGSAADCVAAYVDGMHVAAASESPSPVRLDPVRRAGDGPLAPGDRATFHVAGHVARATPGARVVVGLWVRALPGEDIIFAIHHCADGIDIALPDAGGFDLACDLQMNVGPGLYRIQGFVWDLDQQRELERSGSCVVAVTGGRRVLDRVYLDPRIRLIRP